MMLSNIMKINLERMLIHNQTKTLSLAFSGPIKLALAIFSSSSYVKSLLQEHLMKFHPKQIWVLSIKEIDQVKGLHPTKNRAFPKGLRLQIIYFKYS